MERQGSGLPHYTGGAKECTFCERPFKIGETVFVSGLGMVFCSRKGVWCVNHWHYDHQKVHIGFKAMEFIGDDNSFGEPAFI